MFAEQGSYADLSALLEQDVLQKFDLYTVDTEDGNTAVYGIRLKADSPLHKAGYYHNEVILGAAGRAVHLEEALAFISALSGS